MSPAPRPTGALREFHRPALWLGGWVLGWLLCIALSLIPPPEFGLQLSGADKIGHFLSYALLSAWAVWVFASARGQRLAALALCALGVLLELAQGGLTQYRMMDPRDAIADALGALAGLLLAAGRRGGVLQWLDRRLFGRR